MDDDRTARGRRAETIVYDDVVRECHSDVAAFLRHRGLLIPEGWELPAHQADLFERLGAGERLVPTRRSCWGWMKPPRRNPMLERFLDWCYGGLDVLTEWLAHRGIVRTADLGGSLWTRVGALDELDWVAECLERERKEREE